MLRLFNLPDLTRTDGSPIKTICDKIRSMSIFDGFENVVFPEIVHVSDNFDILNIPENHPSRRKSDTYYVNDNYVLRTQTTTMWPFFFREHGGIEKLRTEGEVKALSYGAVYRKDTLDRSHSPIFHQIDGLYICDKHRKEIEISDLESILVDIAKNIYGDTVEYKVSQDSFPFTNPSVQLDIIREGKEIEILGAGIVHNQVLQNFGIDSSRYNGWAFGFGIERLAMAKMDIPDIRLFFSQKPQIVERIKNIEMPYEAVSKYPSILRDVSFLISKDFHEVDFHELVRASSESDADSSIVDVQKMGEYINDEKFGNDKKSITYRITYCSNERTLTNEEVNVTQSLIRERIEEWLGGVLR
ncbi:MAG: hypothetical protein LBE20_07020 [Deltaproteobacteria bacterium]|nr:hypothetical protein [Deltaproteobacteria bacterium]